VTSLYKLKMSVTNFHSAIAVQDVSPGHARPRLVVVVQVAQLLVLTADAVL
jgi:hypothetical protein